MGKEKFLLLQVIQPHYHSKKALENMAEAAALVETYGGVVVEKVVQHGVKPNPATYFRKGKVEWVKQVVREKSVNVVVLNDIVSSGQKFRLEKGLWEVNRRVKVWDRVDLILEIFEKHASTREAKLQIELARMEHVGPRIYGLGGTVLSRQAAGIGARGKGETNIEFERRVAKKRMQQVRGELRKLAKQKKHRIGRRRELGLGPVALVGYTSAGKTTLFNRMTGKKRQTSRGLFTTLDTVVGRMRGGGEVSVVVSDTIGFIEDLPPKLVEAFASTLMESLDAKLVLHVVDGADGNWERKFGVVEKLLEEMGVEKVWVVVNKVDLLENNEQETMRDVLSGSRVFFVSAKTGKGLGVLKRDVSGFLSKGKKNVLSDRRDFEKL